MALGPHTPTAIFPGRLAWVLLFSGMVCGAPARAEATAENPRLALPRSSLGGDFDAPVFLVAQAGVGGDFSQTNGQFGYGGAVVFRPDAAASFLDFLSAWNTGLVLQVDHQDLFSHYRIRSGDLILRRYLSAAEGAGVLPFCGAGIGISEITFALGEGRGAQSNWSGLVEFGLEKPFGKRWLFLVRGQYRLFNHNGHDYSNWSVRAGLGVPLPW